MLQKESCELIYNAGREEVDEERSWWMKKLRKEENIKKEVEERRNRPSKN